MAGIKEESGHLSDRRLPLPQDMIGNHAEPHQKAQRRAYHQQGHVHGNGSRPASTVCLVAHFRSS